MSPRVKVGLIAGAVGLVLTVCVATAIGFCGPVVPLIAGAIAGYFTVKQEMPAAQGEGGKAGAISGAIAGGLSLIGQVVGGIIALTVLPNIAPQFAQATSGGGDIVYWLSGTVTGLCIGGVGLMLAIIAGYAVGYFSTSKPATPPPAQTM